MRRNTLFRTLVVPATFVGILALNLACGEDTSNPVTPNTPVLTSVDKNSDDAHVFELACTAANKPHLSPSRGSIVVEGLTKTYRVTWTRPEGADMSMQSLTITCDEANTYTKDSSSLAW